MIMSWYCGSHAIIPAIYDCEILFQILLCCKSVAKIHANTSRSEENLLLSMSNYFNGLGLSATAAGNFALLSKALDCLLISAR